MSTELDLQPAKDVVDVAKYVLDHIPPEHFDIVFTAANQVVNWMHLEKAKSMVWQSLPTGRPPVDVIEQTS